MMRLLHKIYANLFGYFWHPCPVCKEYFGGHEIANIWTKPLVGDDGRATCTCPKESCSIEAVRRNIESKRDIPVIWITLEEK